MAVWGGLGCFGVVRGVWSDLMDPGRTSLEDEVRSGCPLDATDKEMCKKVRDLVYPDRRIQVEETAQVLGILHGSVSTILYNQGVQLHVFSPFLQRRTAFLASCLFL